MNIIFFVCGNVSGKNDNVHMKKSFVLEQARVYSSKLELRPKCLDLINSSTLEWTQETRHKGL